MLSFREVLKKQQKKLQSPDMSPEHTSANTIGSKHRNNRVCNSYEIPGRLEKLLILKIQIVIEILFDRLLRCMITHV